MDSVSKATIAKLLRAGALTGTSLGLITNLMKHQKMLQEEAERYEREDSIAPMPVMKEARGLPMVAGGLGLAGGIAAGAGSYALVNKMYQELRRKELMRQLQDAEEAYTDALLEERDAYSKEASKGSRVRLPELVLASAIATLPIAMLGSGFATHKLLDRHFGPQSGTPGLTKLRVEDLPSLRALEEREDDEAMEDDTLSKVASKTWTDDDDVMDHLLGTVCSFTKAAGIRNLVRAAAMGRIKEMEKHASEFGFESIFDIVKGAELHPVKADQFAVGRMRLLKSASLRPSLEAMVAAEMYEHIPNWVTMTATVDPSMGDRALELMGKEAQLRRSAALGYDSDEGMEELTKNASAVTGEGLRDTLDDYIEKCANRNLSLPAYDSQSAMSTNESDPETSNTVAGLVQPSEDIIDVALAGDDKKKTAKPSLSQSV